MRKRILTYDKDNRPSNVNENGVIRDTTIIIDLDKYDYKYNDNLLFIGNKELYDSLSDTTTFKNLIGVKTIDTSFIMCLIYHATNYNIVTSKSKIDILFERTADGETTLITVGLFATKEEAKEEYEFVLSRG